MKKNINQKQICTTKNPKDEGDDGYVATGTVFGLKPEETKHDKRCFIALSKENFTENEKKEKEKNK